MYLIIVYKCAFGILITFAFFPFQLEQVDWQDLNVTTYKVYESMFRVIKESENVDERQQCFLIQTVGGESR